MAGFIDMHLDGDCRDCFVTGQVAQPPDPIAHSDEVTLVREEPEVHFGVALWVRCREKDSAAGESLDR